MRARHKIAHRISWKAAVAAVSAAHGKAISEFFARYEQLGVFSYQDNGFTIHRPNGSAEAGGSGGSKQYFYAEIEAIFAYKVDLVTYDEIRIEIVLGDSVLRITEDTPGWCQFLLTLKDFFPSIPQDWDFEIPFPPFAMNFMVLYKRAME
jgi:hypothetical protein